MEGRRKPGYRSDALEVLHETMSGLYRHGLIDKATMRHFDAGCPTPPRDPDAAGVRAKRNPATRR